LRVVAEGVETDTVRRTVEELGCDIAQGYLWARPLPPAALLEYAVTSRAARVSGAL
jgi:EAL domain-containing protein (putative c-di-GMP-specific phosphodiesterase class I)